MSSDHNRNVRLLANLVDFEDKEEGEYRFLVDEKHVKYVTVEPGTLPRDDRTFAPVLLQLLPPFPPGDWNEGHVSKDPETGSLTFFRYSKAELAGIRNLWHDTKIDHLEFEIQERLRQNIHKVVHPRFEKPVLVKFAEFPWQMPYFEDETAAYEVIHGAGIGPRFLGHLMEADRAIGFIIEFIDGARTAGLDELWACQQALAKLHALGIKHGDINKHNFMVRDGMATLIGFECAKKAGKEDLALEFQKLEESLCDPSHRGGPGVVIDSESMPE